MAQTITIKRGLKADLPVLEPLEIGYCTDTREVFIGSANGNIPIVEALTGAIIVALINAGEDKINDANLSANVADAINKKHSHSNLSILANIQEAFTTALKTKLDGIASGATKVEDSSNNGNIKINNVETNVYTHPTTHPATMITTDSTHEFVKDTDITNWNDANDKKHTHDNLSILQAITQTLIDTWNTVGNKSDIGHKHVKADITDFPTSMPANGGNADTVGGKNPSDFAPSGYGLGTYQNISNNDLNIIISTGLYSGNGMINAPNNSNNGWSVIVLGGSSGHCRQIAISANEDKTIYVRNEIAGTWNGWTQIANISDIPTTLPANGGTSSFLGNAVTVSDYNTLNPTAIAQGNITPIKAPSTANSPWPHTSAGFLIQSNDVDSFHMLIFMSGGDGWAYRSYYKGTWSSWKIWSTFSGSYNDLSNKPSIPTKVSQLTNDSNYAPLASPTFTGTPKAPTPTTADNSTNIATTAFVKAQGYITAAGSGAKIAVSSTVPSSPQPGDFWYKV